ncbi:LacI family DNA-binding transcriptional regulator [Pseudotabrizicola algicola]|uniref:LacI family DNA-binding transcriptional regulator n=1 Tax=Pseudotabrizicola algicola TaxID=2709381 RepID=A0A6B3RTS4_9RHOB|nr:LacI family DNA-binding transcriptional regulator [Pseudotabrizicola algicola]NEX48606.1 LacI family DNA-binding transcriptional regulator [Pseudotabrizicola algicola]
MDNEPSEERRSTRLRKGSGSIGIRDVAERAGVSTATVSRAFNAPKSVSETIRRKVTEAANALAYIPHNAARALSSQRSRNIGIVIPTIQNSIFATQVESLQQRAAGLGYNLLVALAGFNRDIEAEKIQQLVRTGVDGIMLIGADHRAEVYRLLQSRDIAYVNTSVFNATSPHPNVGFNNAEAMSRIAKYLISIGHLKICVISGDVVESDRARLRLEGIRNAMKSAGLPLPDEQIRICAYEMSASRQACRDLLNRTPDATAIMCHNDVQAFGALLELQSLGLRVPEDISVTGFDDLEWARHLSPALTTVRVPWGKMAELAAEVLVAQLNGSEFPQATLLDFDLVVRDSTAPPRPRP